MLTIDTSGFVAMTQGLAKLSGKSFEDALAPQVGRLMQTCIDYTHAANKQSIMTSVIYKNSRFKDDGVSVSQNYKPGKGGRIWMIEESTWGKSSWQRKNATTGKTNASGSTHAPKYFGTKTAHLMNGNRRWSNERWARYQAIVALMATRQIKYEDALRSQGLAKKSWYDIAVVLGVDAFCKTTNYVKSAGTFRGGPAPQMSSGSKVTEGDSLYYELINFSKTLTAGIGSSVKKGGGSLDGAEILQRAMNARAAAFEHDLQYATSGKIVNWASRYPGIFIK